MTFVYIIHVMCCLNYHESEDDFVFGALRDDFDINY